MKFAKEIVRKKISSFLGRYENKIMVNDEFPEGEDVVTSSKQQ